MAEFFAKPIKPYKCIFSISNREDGTVWVTGEYLKRQKKKAFKISDLKWRQISVIISDEIAMFEKYIDRRYQMAGQFSNVDF